MKLYIVVYSIGGYAREDAPSVEVAGVFTDENIANTVSKAVGLGAKVVPTELDVVGHGYKLFAKEVLGIDLEKKMIEKEIGLVKMSDFDRECLMTAEEFNADNKAGCILPCDGSGSWATEELISNISCFNKQPEWATHVCWFNK